MWNRQENIEKVRHSEKNCFLIIYNKLSINHARWKIGPKSPSTFHKFTDQTIFIFSRNCTFQTSFIEAIFDNYRPFFSQILDRFSRNNAYIFFLMGEFFSTDLSWWGHLSFLWFIDKQRVFLQPTHGQFYDIDLQYWRKLIKIQHSMGIDSSSGIRRVILEKTQPVKWPTTGSNSWNSPKTLKISMLFGNFSHF